MSGRRKRRREIAERLSELDVFENSAEVADLKQEEEHLGELTPILVLSNARVWGPGHDPLQGPIEVPFVRIRVAAISAWWLGTETVPSSTLYIATQVALPSRARS
jgi:hypothetical protein